MNKVGEHITLDFLGVYENHSAEFYEKIFKKIAEVAKVEIVNISKYVFTPQGVTLLCLLKESHMSFHTFPITVNTNSICSRSLTVLLT